MTPVKNIGFGLEKSLLYNYLCNCATNAFFLKQNILYSQSNNIKTIRVNCNAHIVALANLLSEVGFRGYKIITYFLKNWDISSQIVGAYHGKQQACGARKSIIHN